MYHFYMTMKHLFQLSNKSHSDKHLISSIFKNSNKVPYNSIKNEMSF